MHVIVVGCGRVGASLATSLSLQGHDVVIVANDAESFGRLGSAFNGMTVRGLGFDEETLRQAGVEHADVLAAVTSNDNDNLMVAEVAQRVFGVRRVIARAYEPSRERVYQLLGIDSVCGTRLVTAHILERLERDLDHHLASLGDIQVVRFQTTEAMAGLTVDEVQDRCGVRVASISRDGVSFVPMAETRVHAGDTAVAAIAEDSYARFQTMLEEEACISS